MIKNDNFFISKDSENDEEDDDETELFVGFIT